MADVTPCLLWSGRKTPKGYGTIERGDGRSGTRFRVLAHRQAFLNRYGYLPPVVRHICDTPACVEPTHLLPGTQAHNVSDMYDRGRARHLRGEQSGRARLTEDDVREIKAAQRAGESRRQVARRFGVSEGCIQNIYRGSNWRHVA